MINLGFHLWGLIVEFTVSFGLISWGLCKECSAVHFDWEEFCHLSSHRSWKVSSCGTSQTAGVSSCDTSQRAGSLFSASVWDCGPGKGGPSYLFSFSALNEISWNEHCSLVYERNMVDVLVHWPCPPIHMTDGQAPISPLRKSPD